MMNCIYSKKKSVSFLAKQKEIKLDEKIKLNNQIHSNKSGINRANFPFEKFRNCTYPPKSEFTKNSKSFFKRVEKGRETERNPIPTNFLKKRANEIQEFNINNISEKHFRTPNHFLEEKFFNYFDKSAFQTKEKNNQFKDQENFLEKFPHLPMKFDSDRFSEKIRKSTRFTENSQFNQREMERTKILNPITNNNFNIYNVIETPRTCFGKMQQPLWSKFKSLKSAKVLQSFNQNNTCKFKKIKYKCDNLQLLEQNKSDREEIDQKTRGKFFSENFQKLELNFESVDPKLSKKKLKYIKNDFLRLLDSFNKKYQSELQVTWKNLSEISPLKLEENFDLSLLKEQMQLQTPLVVSSDQFVPSMVNNVKWNSFLRSPSQMRFLTQTQGSVSKILSYLENNQKKLIYHQNNIITLVNLQVPLCNEKFQNLSKRIKLRVICMLFAKYVNRKTLSQICEDFLPEMQITDHNLIRAKILR